MSQLQSPTPEAHVISLRLEIRDLLRERILRALQELLDEELTEAVGCGA